ncbi:MAG TPA: hypothetical protein VMU67_15550 [Steroidobacteraceae bacterium]|nr:hypothetical protein [Steroidobacteraceae bacterium]
MNANAVETAREAPLARTAHVRPLATLVRREFWEHRMLWITPLVIAALMICGAAFGRMQFDAHREVLPLQAARALFALAVWGFSVAQYFTMSLVLYLYAAECLYAERRDRSILFWKSMPVSDARTVLAKALVALVIVPLGVYAITVVTGLIASGIFFLRASNGASFWDTRTWMRVEETSLVGLVIGTLWYAPITTYVMLLSAWARRNVHLWVFVPPLVAVFCEQLAFGTHHFSNALLYRLGPGSWMAGLQRSVERLFLGPGFNSAGAPAGPVNPQLLEGRMLLQVFTNIDLWLGLAVAAAFLFAAVRIRRYRDDT